MLLALLLPYYVFLFVLVYFFFKRRAFSALFVMLSVDFTEVFWISVTMLQKSVACCVLCVTLDRHHIALGNTLQRDPNSVSIYSLCTTLVNMVFRRF
jgi:hypothetical protein